MPMNPTGNHWVTAIIDLYDSQLLVLDSMHSMERRELIRKFVLAWTVAVNTCLEELGHFSRTGRGHYSFEFHYNNVSFTVPQQENSSDCGVITCWLIHQFITYNWPPQFDTNNVDVFFADVRCSLGKLFYLSRCEDTSSCGYD
jgi:Ulp1 family protease